MPLGTAEVVEVFRVAGRLLLKVRMTDGSAIQTGDTLEYGQSSCVVKAVSFVPAEAWAAGLRLLEIDVVSAPQVGERLQLRR
jgi:hypothetical protein